jgi:hypothetical protein
MLELAEAYRQRPATLELVILSSASWLEAMAVLSNITLVRRSKGVDLRGLVFNTLHRRKFSRQWVN